MGIIKKYIYSVAYKEGDAFITIFNRYNFKMKEAEYRKLFFKRIIDFAKRAFEDKIAYSKSKKRVRTPQKNLSYFEVHLVEHCNLNCQACTHYSPLAEPGFASIEIMERDFKRLSELSEGNVTRMSLMGGEPLLHPNVADFFYLARKYFPKTRIQLVTNAILLANQPESFFEAAKENDVVIMPTKYPLNIDWEKINALIKKYDLKMEFFNDAKVVKTSFKIPLNLKGRLNYRREFNSCWIANECVYLSNGKMYTCCMPGNIHHFNKFFNQNIKVTKKDYIDIHEAKSMKQILKFLSTPIPFCRYCNIRKIEYDRDWKTSSRKIEEWIE